MSFKSTLIDHHRENRQDLDDLEDEIHEMEQEEEEKRNEIFSNGTQLSYMQLEKMNDEFNKILIEEKTCPEILEYKKEIMDNMMELIDNQVNL